MGQEAILVIPPSDKNHPPNVSPKNVFGEYTRKSTAAPQPLNLKLVPTLLGAVHPPLCLLTPKKKKSAPKPPPHHDPFT